MIFSSCFLRAVLLACLFCGSITLISCGPSGHGYPENKLLVPTQFGYVKGMEFAGARVWGGIPYAKPPVGELRWKAPVDPDYWPGIRDATSHCSECTQRSTDNFMREIPNVYIGSEDCLVLDIYRPATDENNLPVAVFIHGGGNRTGSAKPYLAVNFAQKGNMVVVVIQYRLGTLGWLTHPALRASGTALDQSGNYGTLDTMKALSWVQNNIAAFGGDPSRVGIAGQSAGGHNVMNLIISPMPNIFHKAFAMSPALKTLMPLRTVAQGDAQANAIIDWLLVDDGTCANAAAAAAYHAGMTNTQIASYLRSKTDLKIIQATIGGGVYDMPTAFMDGTVMPTVSWLDAINAGNFKKAPIIIGTTQYEFKDLMIRLNNDAVKLLYNVPSGAYNWDNLYDVVEGTLTFDQVLPTDTDKVAHEQTGLLKSRKWQAECNAIARAIKANDPANTVYSYLFTWGGGGDPALETIRKIYGAAHALDVMFWFDIPYDIFGYANTDANAGGRASLAGAMSDYLCSFVNTGNPNPGGSSLPIWTQWSNTPADPKFIRMDADLNQYQISMDNAEVTTAIVTGEITTVLGNYPGFAGLFSATGIWPY